jgi:hypothetical protein
MNFFEILPGEMQRIDPPEGGDDAPLEITPEEVAYIQAMMQAMNMKPNLEDEKMLFLQRMQELCPFTLPSNTMH